MPFNDEQKKQLGRPLSAAHVRERKGPFGPLSYVEGWKAIEEANRIFGFDGWDRNTFRMDRVDDHQYTNEKGVEMWSVSYMSSVAVCAGGVVRQGTGFGQGIAKDKGQAIESAIKEAETDATKRALMTFGYPFGLALYDKEKANVSDLIEQWMIDEIQRLAEEVSPDDWQERIRVWLDKAKVETLEDLTARQGNTLLEAIQAQHAQDHPQD